MAAIATRPSTHSGRLRAQAHGDSNVRSIAFLVALWLCLAFGVLS